MSIKTGQSADARRFATPQREANAKRAPGSNATQKKATA